MIILFIVVSLLFAIIPSVVLIKNMKYYYQLRIKKDPTKELIAQVLKSSLNKDDSGNEIHNIFYEYEVSGIKYRSKRKNAFGNFSSSFDVSGGADHRHFSKYKEIRIFYNERKPQYSWIESEFGFTEVLGNIVLLALASISFYALIELIVYTAINGVNNFG